jgi:hypothetical protein
MLPDQQVFSQVFSCSLLRSDSAFRGCNACSTFKCVPLNSSSSNSGGSHGTSVGALAGGILGALLFFVVAVIGLQWYRRRRPTPTSGLGHVKEDIPAPASTVLNRPDPTEKPTPPTELNTVRVYTNSSNTTIDLDPTSQSSAMSSPARASPASVRSNPFTDNQSIQTTGTDGTNVIPIALVAPPGSSMTSSVHSDSDNPATAPTRPLRAPELNLDHVNISHESLRAGRAHGASSQRSGVSGISSRNSYMSNASYSSDFLHETAMMVTPAVRQVLGVVKAEVIQTPVSNSPPSSSSGLRVPSKTTRPIGSSPLALASYGPADLAKEADEAQELSVHGDPFDDEHSPLPIGGAATIAPSPNSAATFGDSNSSGGSSEWLPESPTHPWSQSGDDTTRSSLITQAGSVIDIGSATRVNVGLGSPLSGGAFLQVPYRTTMGRLVTPPSNANVGTLEEQQQRALAHAQARAQAQGLDKNRRVSNSSVLSAASTRADSILESFPFVPPSPISDRPIRSPPHSPLGQQVFSGSSVIKDALPSESTEPEPKSIASPRLTPALPNRSTLGLSTASDFSTLSSGLGSFPFQIDSGNAGGANTPPSAFKGRQRASLDTLALTSDLSSYPLGLDRDSMEQPTHEKNTDSR